MSAWETNGKTYEWYTPPEIFIALNTTFDLDVAVPVDRTYCHTPARKFITEKSLETEWDGFVWCNPPFGGRNGIVPWLDKMASHANGIALTPDRTSAPWWQKAAKEADAILFINGKPKFIKPDGSTGKQPGNGVTLLGYGHYAVECLIRARNNGLGVLLEKLID